MMELPLIDKEESVRIHADWWGKCRSCRFWGGTDEQHRILGFIHRWNPGPCNNPASGMFGEETWTEGHCRKWDSFDIETALEMLEESNAKDLACRKE